VSFLINEATGSEQVMGKNIKSSVSASYPHLWRWVREFGRVEIGYCRQTRSFIRVVDAGGMVWQGRRSYRTLEAALADAEAGIARWMKDELGITDAA
jgi:hypothetical protein